MIGSKIKVRVQKCQIQILPQNLKRIYHNLKLLCNRHRELLSLLTLNLKLQLQV